MYGTLFSTLWIKANSYLHTEGLSQRQPWAHTLAIVVAICSLLAIPLGTPFLSIHLLRFGKILLDNKKIIAILLTTSDVLPLYVAADFAAGNIED